MTDYRQTPAAPTDGQIGVKTAAWVFMLILAVLCAAYLPALHGYYVHHDDYYFWVWNRSSYRHYPTAGYLALQCGRPLAPMILCALGSVVRSIPDANFARFITVVNLAVLGFLVFVWLRRHGFVREHAFLFVIAAYTLPAFQSDVGTISNSHHVTACLFGFVATGLLWFGVGQVEARPGVGILSRWVKGVIFAAAGIAAICATLMTYQPSAMIFWFLLAAALLNVPVGSPGRWNLRLALLTAAGAAGMLIYYLFMKSLPSADGQAYSTAVTGEYWRKIEWFVGEPLSNAMNFWKLFPSRALALWVGGVLVAGWAASLLTEVWLACKQVAAWRLAVRCLLKYGVAPILVLLCYLPNLAAAKDHCSYRTMLVLSPCLLLLLLWAVGGLLRVLPERRRKKVVTAILLAGCLLGVWTAHFNMMNYYVLPQTMELRYIKARIAQAGADGFDEIVIIRPDPPGYSFVASQSRYDEFATSATGFVQDIPQIVVCAIRELNRERRGLKPFEEIRPTSVLKKDFEGPKEGTLVIDMTRFDGLY